ncbi:uncharacterized protein LOC120165634 [Hibiscus syriacus]|uniref:uncharacterized protein LOC120165634 n=1 Tax=Hibiscus syriacus TaxID=106335 RepID=UPI001920A245|nr:uncharacterized protein LOC120165634 [Hibiscus syriacus]
MDHSSSGEGPAILQLHKWDPSELPLNLSEYREAFISPTRELLLLLSYKCQALLLPLTTGGSVDTDISEICHEESPQHLDLLACTNLKDDFRALLDQQHILMTVFPLNLDFQSLTVTLFFVM